MVDFIHHSQNERNRNPISDVWHGQDDDSALRVEQKAVPARKYL